MVSELLVTGTLPSGGAAFTPYPELGDRSPLQPAIDAVAAVNVRDSMSAAHWSAREAMRVAAMDLTSGTEERGMRATTDVMLRTNDFDAAKKHYNGGLGFPIVTDEPNVLGFDMGGFVLYFEHGEDNGSVFEFEVSDVSRTKERLLAQGCALVEEDPGKPRCYMRDRFGLIFNLTQTFR